jgi:PAS domain-containing protein
MTSDAIITAVSWLIGVIVSMAGAIAGWKVVKREVVTPIIGHIINIRQMSEMVGTLAKLLPKIDIVVKMVLPNGGSSMVDALKRIEDKVQVLTAQGDSTNALATFNLQTSSRAAFRCNEHGENDFINISYCQLLGCDSTQLLGLGWRSFVWDINEYDQNWMSIFKEGRECRFELTLRKEDGSPLYTVVHILPLKRGTPHHGYLGMIDHVLPSNDRLVNEEEPPPIHRASLRPRRRL